MEYKSGGVAIAGDGVQAENEYIRGYASTFGEPPDMVNDVVEEGAFSKTIAERTPRFLWSHKADQLPIGVIDLLQETPDGLFFRAKPLDIQMGREAKTAVDAGAVLAASIGFDVVDKTYIRGTRHIKTAVLYEISLVNFPANPKARLSTAAKSGLLDLLYIAETEALRAAGYPVSGGRMLRYVKAQVRQAERDLYGGHTVKWWLSEIWRMQHERELELRREVALLGRELAELSS